MYHRPNYLLRVEILTPKRNENNNENGRNDIGGYGDNENDNNRVRRIKSKMETINWSRRESRRGSGV